MSKKSLIDVRNFVPEYFGNNREFQVFLRAVNIALSVIKSNTDNFIPNLLDPLRCKARLLPLLSNYVGWDYNPKERVVTNRWITKLYPLLIRNRGNEIGITLAIALSICLLGDPDDITYEKSFSMEIDSSVDKYGRTVERLRIYMYIQSYLPILKDLIETVRPAGMMVEFIPAQSISSTETISLTDEYSIMKYDYITGKLLSINDINVYIQNSWKLLVDEHAIAHYKWKDLEEFIWDELKSKTWGELEDTGIEPYAAIPGLAPYNVKNKEDNLASVWNASGVRLTDGRFYDKYNNDMGRYVDQETGKIMYDNGDWNNEIIRETRIYKINPLNYQETYTGMHFDVSEPAKVLNTYYKLLDAGVFSGFYLSNDDFTIYNADNMNSCFKLVESITTINGISKTVWKVFDSKTNVKYNWHVDMFTRHFEKDDDGDEIIYNQLKIPFSETTYIGKKAYLMKSTTENGVTSISASKYFVNKYGDIVDPAGNIILSKKDRYKVSDSTMIGFSEVHNSAKQLSTYDGTAILQREWSFIKDSHITDTHGRAETNSFEDYQKDNDPRIKLEYENFDIGYPVREYTGNDLIRFISNVELQTIVSKNGVMSIPLFITDFDSENASGELKIKADLPNVYSLADVFKNINIRYSNYEPNDEINPKWDIYIDWVPNDKNINLFNLSKLENPIHFIEKGTIEPRTLHWTGETIKISPKVYDGTTKVYTIGGNIT